MDWALHRGARILPVNRDSFTIPANICWCSTLYSRVLLPSVTWRRDLQVFTNIKWDLLVGRIFDARRAAFIITFDYIATSKTQAQSDLIKCMLTSDGLRENWRWLFDLKFKTSTVAPTAVCPRQTLCPKAVLVTITNLEAIKSWGRRKTADKICRRTKKRKLTFWDL